MISETGAALTIGRSYNWGRHTGVIDEVALYDKALSPARVCAHYDVGKRALRT